MTVAEAPYAPQPALETSSRHSTSSRRVCARRQRCEHCASRGVREHAARACRRDPSPWRCVARPKRGARTAWQPRAGWRGSRARGARWARRAAGASVANVRCAAGSRGARWTAWPSAVAQRSPPRGWRRALERTARRFHCCCYDIYSFLLYSTEVKVSLRVASQLSLKR
eukprot:scaffold219368_cov33-Tisochrysis_lutea.AAC.4